MHRGSLDTASAGRYQRGRGCEIDLFSYRHGRITLTFSKRPLQNVFANVFADVTVDKVFFTLKGYTISSTSTIPSLLLLT